MSDWRLAVMVPACPDFAQFRADFTIGACQVGHLTCTFRFMTKWRKGLACMVGLLLASVAVADPVLPPVMHGDAADQHAQIAGSALAGFRPLARPIHLIGRPVEIESTPAKLRPRARNDYAPLTRWEHKQGSEMWTRAAMSAVAADGAGLTSLVPRDIAQWCPGYSQNSEQMRRAFWVGLMSALAKYESTHDARAVGGGGRWFGLLQISPGTARSYGCRARTGEALTDPTENLSCAARIMGRTVNRDGVIASFDGRRRGLAADWAPMSNRDKRNAMASWLRDQDYCRVQSRLRPHARPAQPWPRTVAADAG